MPKIRKLKRKKRFRANVNRKRLRNKLNKLPTIKCKQIREAWENKASTFINLQQMGLAYDPNKVFKIPKVKNEMIKFVKDGEEVSDSDNEQEKVVPKKSYIAESLEEEAKWPRAKMFRLSNNEVQFATYMMDKYGDDYKAMVRDRKNYNQLTWRQIKAKIEKFKSIPEQYAEYLVKKGEIILEDSTPLKNSKKMKNPDIINVAIEKKSDTGKISKRKKKKTSILESVWKEESIGEENSDNNNLNKSISDSPNNDVSNEHIKPEKKLQLFSDDKSDDDDDDDDDNESSNDESDEDSKDESSNDEDQIDVNIKSNKNKLENTRKSKIVKQKTKKLKLR